VAKRGAKLDDLVLRPDRSALEQVADLSGRTGPPPGARSSREHTWSI
jgi:hypothetical protein